MTDRLEIQNQEDIDLKKELDKVHWPIEHGSVTLQLRFGRVTLIRVERTIQFQEVIDALYSRKPTGGS